MPSLRVSAQTQSRTSWRARATVVNRNVRDATSGGDDDCCSTDDYTDSRRRVKPMRCACLCQKFDPRMDLNPNDAGGPHKGRNTRLLTRSSYRTSSILNLVWSFFIASIVLLSSAFSDMRYSSLLAVLSAPRSGLKGSARALLDAVERRCCIASVQEQEDHSKSLLFQRFLLARAEIEGQSASLTC